MIQRIAAFAFAGITGILLFPPCLIGEELDFMPRVDDFTGSLEFTMSHRDNDTKVGDLDTRTNYNQTLERIRFDSVGYVYLPSFIIFRLAGAAGLTQGSYSTEFSTNKTSQGFDEYDARATLLPSHPYNLEVFTRRQIAPMSPLNPERSIDTSQGATFRYRERPYTLYLDTVHETLERLDSIDTKQQSAGGSYLIGPFTNSAGYHRTDSQTSGGTQAVRTNSNFSNALKLDAVTLESSVGADRQRQTNPAEVTPSIGTDSSTWSEHMNLYLPLNFTAFLYHDYRKDVVTTTQTLPSLEETETFSKNNNDTVTIAHKLYNSLRTSYSANDSTTRTTGGDYKTFVQTLAFGYIKKIPTGNLHADVSFVNRTSSRTGAVSVTNEAHSAGVPGTFFLSNANADASTISLLVSDPDTLNLVQLTLGANYQVQSFSNSVQITVLSLPAYIRNMPSYTFLVSYSLVPNDVKTVVKDRNISLGFMLFDGLFSPYVGYATSDQAVVSETTSTANTDDNTTTTTYGAVVQKSPFTLATEYSEHRSRLSPYRNMLNSMDYRKKINEDIDITGRFVNSQTVRPATDASAGYFEKTNTVQVTAHKTYENQRLNLYVSGSYGDKKFTGANARSLRIYTILNWHLGELDVSVTASKTNTSTVWDTSEQTSQDIAYYITVSRKLF